MLFNEGDKVKLIWTPGHVGILGNERADQEARNAAKSPIDTSNTEIPVDDIIRAIENFEGAKPFREKLNGFTRTEQVAISRLRMGYTRKSHRHVLERFKRTDYSEPPTCIHCGLEETVEHVIWECPKYETERRTSGIESSENIWTREQGERILIFAKKINYMKNI